MSSSRPGILLAARGVAVVVVIISLSQPTRGQPVQPADQVIRNANVITVDSGSRIAQAVAIRGDRIVAVGSNDELRPWIGPDTRIIDAGGKTVLPGLYDSHVHPLGAAQSEADHPIPVFESLADVMAYIAGRVKAQPKGTWIVARYAFPTRLAEGRFPDPSRARRRCSRSHGVAPGGAGRRGQHQGSHLFGHHPRHCRSTGRADRQGPHNGRADGNAPQRLFRAQGPARRCLRR